MLLSKVNLSGLVVNGVMLGDPVAPVRGDGSPAQFGDSMADLFWMWDDPRVGSGVATLVDGNVELSQL